MKMAVALRNFWRSLWLQVAAKLRALFKQAVADSFRAGAIARPLLSQAASVYG